MAKSMEASVLNLKGEEVGKVALPEKVFGVRPSPVLLHEATTTYLSNQRSGTAHTKTRAEVSGGGKKPWKQKHTGRARHGSIRSPIWRKGGVCFGPRSRSWRLEMPRKKSRQALAQALSARVLDGGLKIVDSISLDGAKTQQVAAFLKALKAETRALVVTEVRDANLALAARNVPDLRIVLVSHLNAYEVLAYRHVIITRKALDKLTPRWN
jgi:large subunit ribosomal protein L4